MGIQGIIERAKKCSADLACGSSSCPHSRHKGGIMVNGPCRCYMGQNTQLKQFVYAATELMSVAEKDLLPNHVNEQMQQGLQFWYSD